MGLIIGIPVSLMLPPSTINTTERTPESEELLESGTVILTFAVITDVAMIVGVAVVGDELVAAIVVILHSSNMSWSVPGTVQLNFAIIFMVKEYGFVKLELESIILL